MTLKKEDLIQNCEDCQGFGVIYDPPRKESSGSGFGSSLVQGSYSWQTCMNCQGKGQVLTEAGEAIAAVIKFVR